VEIVSILGVSYSLEKDNFRQL